MVKVQQQHNLDLCMSACLSVVIEYGIKPKFIGRTSTTNICRGIVGSGTLPPVMIKYDLKPTVVCFVRNLKPIIELVH